VGKLFALAVSPALICLFYMYIRDKYEKEPLRLLLVGTIFGIVSVFPIMQLEHVLLSFMPILSSDAEAVYTAFFVAALAEQGMRFLLLFMLTWQNHNLNEKLDGIVYAVFISLGFALTENILYVFNPLHGGLETAIMRAIVSVPSHGFFGIIMGYYFTMSKFENRFKTKYMLKAFFVPWLVHGIYDAILLYGHRFYLLVFVPFLAVMWYNGFRKINLHLKASPFRKL